MTAFGPEVIETTPVFNASLKALLARAGTDGLPALLTQAFGPGDLPDGVDYVDTVDQRTWEGLYARLQSADEAGAVLPPLPSAAGRAESNDGVTPIGLFDVRYRRPTRATTRAILRARREDAAIALPEEPLDTLFETRTAFAASALPPARYWAFERLSDAHRGLTVRFRLAREFWRSNGALPDRVEVDFDDGEGFRDLAWDEIRAIEYGVAGEQRVVLRAHFGECVRTAAFRLEVEETSIDASPLSSGPPRTQKIPAAIPHNGRIYEGVCHCYNAFNNQTGRLRRPILLAEGFPGANPVGDIYDYFNGRNPVGWNPDAKLADALRARGHDVVILIFSTQGAPIQGNAFVYLAALQWMYSDMSYQGQIAAAGGSMGGLIARYALTYAEFGPAPHRVDLHYVKSLITFDSPHQGANVPLAVQYTARYFGRLAQSQNDLLNYECAKQMLVHQIWTWNERENVVKDTYLNFYRELEGLGNRGYPTKQRKYAICNGAKDGAPIIATREAKQLEMNYLGELGYRVILYCTANRVITEPYAFVDLRHILIGYHSICRLLPSPSPFYSRDGGGGGIAAFVERVRNSVATCSINPHVDMPNGRVCFVPTYSALGVAWQGDAYTFTPGRDAPGQTPFDEWYAPAGNQWHCTVDSGIKDWVLRLFPQVAESQADEALEAVD